MIMIKLCINYCIKQNYVCVCVCVYMHIYIVCKNIKLMCRTA